VRIVAAQLMRTGRVSLAGRGDGVTTEFEDQSRIRAPESDAGDEHLAWLGIGADTLTEVCRDPANVVVEADHRSAGWL
jgi:hypothetical protein